MCSWCDIAFEDLSFLHLHMGVHIDFVGPGGLWWQRRISVYCTTVHVSNTSRGFLQNNILVHSGGCNLSGARFVCGFSERITVATIFANISVRRFEEPPAVILPCMERTVKWKYLKWRWCTYMLCVCNIGFDKKERFGNNTKKQKRQIFFVPFAVVILKAGQDVLC